MPYHISWNLRKGTAGIFKPWGRARKQCPQAVLNSCIVQDKRQNQPQWVWRELGILIQRSMTGKQKHYQNLQHCELLSMNHENQSGEREKQENCLFLLIWAETNYPSNTYVYRSQNWPTSLLWNLWHHVSPKIFLKQGSSFSLSSPPQSKAKLSIPINPLVSINKIIHAYFSHGL